MHKSKHELLKGSFIVVAAALSPCLAFGQAASVDTIQLASPYTETTDSGPNSNVLIGTLAAPIAEASAIESSHTFSAYATGTPAQAYEADSRLMDTFTASANEFVQLEVVIPDSFGGAGSWENFQTMTLEVGTVNSQDEGDFTTGDVTYAPNHLPMPGLDSSIAA
jgi:hypothetical protein